MNKTRESILARLRESRQPQSELPTSESISFDWSPEKKRQHFTQMMTAVHTEVVDLTDGNWIDWVNNELPKRGLKHLLIGTTEDAQLLQDKASDEITIRSYDESIENWKGELFNQIDASITSTLGGIAETGSLILWPDSNEPRLMSLVPPVHIALLQADKLHQTFAQVVAEQKWAENMPTNALLISGPSKTADIEQTLAYGIHGPQQLIVLIID